MSKRRRKREDFPVRGLLTAGWTVIALFVGCLAAWSAQAPLASAIIAPGVLVVESSRKLVQHLEGGIVSAILVRDGDRVRAGDALVELDPTASRSHLARLRHRIDALRARQARLIAERDGRAAVTFSPALEARRKDERVSALMAGQVALFEAGKRAREGEIRLLSKRVEILRQQIAGLHAQIAAKDRQIALIRDEHAGLSRLLDKGYVPKTRVLALERATARLEGERAGHLAEIAQAEKEIGETELRMIQMRKRFRNEVVSQLTEVDKQIADFREQETAAADVLERTTVSATADGVVVNMSVQNVGEVVEPGGTILEIVPEADHLIVEARVRPRDIDRVSVGQEAEVRLSAFDRKATPAVPGIVSYVSADRLTTAENKSPYYAVKIRLKEKAVRKGKNLFLIPGMPAEIFIKSGSRTLFTYISRPLADAFHRAMRE